MGSQTRNQEYTYQYKNISIGSGATVCGRGPSLQINLPNNVLAIKSLFMRVVIQYNTSETNPGIDKITLNGVPNFTFFYSGTVYSIPVKWQPNSTSHILDARIDLQGVLPHLHIFPGAAGNQPYIIIGMAAPNSGFYSNNNTCILWKIDLIYTTRGIR